jgi:putative flippase GtrA
MADEPAESSGVEPRTAGTGHWLGFLASGIVAFVVDASVLALMVHGAGLDAYVSRLLAIAVAMVAGWLAHRRWTFRVEAPPGWAEFARFALSASSAAAINYGLYALLITFVPAPTPLPALVIASAATMLYSYVAMRYAVFR